MGFAQTERLLFVVWIRLFEISIFADNILNLSKRKSWNIANGFANSSGKCYDNLLIIKWESLNLQKDHIRTLTGKCSVTKCFAFSDNLCFLLDNSIFQNQLCFVGYSNYFVFRHYSRNEFKNSYMYVKLWHNNLKAPVVVSLIICPTLNFVRFLIFIT